MAFQSYLCPVFKWQQISQSHILSLDPIIKDMNYTHEWEGIQINIEKKWGAYRDRKNDCGQYYK